MAPGARRSRRELVGVNGSGKTTLRSCWPASWTRPAGSARHDGPPRRAVAGRPRSATCGCSSRWKGARCRDAQRQAADHRVLLCDRFGFRGDRARTLVRDLSGGERRRLQLMRLLMAEPNVLLLDERTNDLDIDTLTALEDLLDSWPGTLVVVSHDRYFIERVCDNVYGLLGDGGLRHLPGRIEQYVEQRRAASTAAQRAARPAAPKRPGRRDSRRPQGCAASSGRSSAWRSARLRARRDGGQRQRPRTARGADRGPQRACRAARRARERVAGDLGATELTADRPSPSASTPRRPTARPRRSTRDRTTLRSGQGHRRAERGDGDRNAERGPELAGDRVDRGRGAEV